MSKPETRPVIYTLGYLNGWNVDALGQLAALRDAIVIDTRYNPQSRLPAWRRGSLAKQLGDLYQHHQSLGNVNYKNGGPIKLSDPPKALSDLSGIVSSGTSLILMCACKDHGGCHRANAAEYLAAELGLDVVHLKTASEELADENF